MSAAGFASAKELSGRAAGCLFFIGFGTVWVLTSLGALHWLRPWSAGAVVAAGGLLFLHAWRVSARIERLAGPEPAERPAEEMAVMRVFKWVNVAQWVAIPLVVMALILLRRPEWIVPAIGIIVGLHLLPLARAFRYPAHYVTAALLIVWSVVAIVGMPRTMAPGWGALGTGLILLGSACVTLLRVQSAARALGFNEKMSL